MLEVAHPGEVHRHSVAIAECDRIGITHRTTGLNHRSDALCLCEFNAISERDEGIGSHHGPFEGEAEGARFRGGLAEGVDAGSLAGPAAEQLAVASEDDGVRAGVFCDALGKYGVVYLGGGGRGDRNLLQVRYRL